MNRNGIVVLLVALVCAGGLAIAAATVSTPTGGDPGTGSGTGSGSDNPTPPEDESGSGGIDIPDWLQALAVALFVLSLLGAVYLALKRLNAGEAVKLIAIGVVASLLILAVMAAMADTSEFDRNGGEPQVDNESGGGVDGEGGPGRQPAENPTTSTDVPVVLVGVFGLVVLVLVATIYRFSGSDSDVDLAEPVDEDTGGGAGAVQAVGEAAGRAADDLEAADGDLENAVYRAWREMTDALAVDSPRTTTPEEFADVAIDAGMAPDDVRELTWLFEEVRYGDATATGDRERRARKALRRIQEAYADQEGADDE